MRVRGTSLYLPLGPGSPGGPAGPIGPANPTNGQVIVYDKLYARPARCIRSCSGTYHPCRRCRCAHRCREFRPCHLCPGCHPHRPVPALRPGPAHPVHRPVHLAPDCPDSQSHPLGRAGPVYLRAHRRRADRAGRDRPDYLSGPVCRAVRVVRVGSIPSSLGKSR